MSLYKDICIVGTALPGLIAGRLLQRKGAHVCFLEPLATQAFDPAGGEFFSGILIKPLMQRLGIHPQEMQKFTPLALPMQFISPYRRINFFEALDQFALEIDREQHDEMFFQDMLKTEAKEDLLLFHQVYDRHIRVYEKKALFGSQKRKVLNMPSSQKTHHAQSKRSVLSQMNLRPLDDHFLSMLEMTFTCAVQERLSVGRARLMQYLLRHKGYQSMFGLVSFKSMLISLLKEHGATFVPFKTLQDIEIKKHQVQSIKYTNPDPLSIGCSQLIINGNSARCLKHLPSGDAGIKQITTPEIKKIGRKVYCLFKIKHAFLPEGIGSQGVIYPKKMAKELSDRRDRPRMLRYLILTPKLDTDTHNLFMKLDPNDALIAVTYFDDIKGPPNHTRMMREIFERMQSLIPFFTDMHVTLMLRYDPLEADDQGDLREGWLYSSTTKVKHDFWGESISTPYKNLWRVGESTFPALGLDGQILAGDQLAQTLT